MLIKPPRLPSGKTGIDKNAYHIRKNPVFLNIIFQSLIKPIE